MKSELVGLPPELDAVTAISRSMASTADAPLHHINTASSPEPMEHGGAETERLSRSFESVLSRKAANVFRAGRSAAYRPLQRMTLSYAFSRAERLRMTRFYSMISNRRKEQRREPVEMTSPGTLLQYFSEPVGGTEYLLPQGRPAAEATQYAAGQSPARAQGTAGNIIYRIPVSEGTPAAHAGQTETSGEDVLRMQTVSSDAVKGLNAAYSFDAAGPQQPAAGTAREITREQEERILQRIISDVNYNRMADELLIRIERRLRAERRKFGK